MELEVHQVGGGTTEARELGLQNEEVVSCRDTDVMRVFSLSCNV